jgi:GTPase Era involved in 16S rRNA processing
VLSKIDTVDKDEVKKKIKALEKASKNKNVIALSLYEDDTVKAFGDSLIQKLSEGEVKKVKEVKKEVVSDVEDEEVLI